MDWLRRRWPMLVAAAVVLAVVVAILLGMKKGGSEPARAPKISLIPTTPPPPPPPPKEEKRPEPPKEAKEAPQEQQAPKEAPPAPATADLKMEGAAGDGPSPFTAGRVTREDIGNVGKTGAGGGGPAGGPFDPFNNYATLLKGEVQRLLTRDRELRSRSFRVDVQVWVGKDGSLSRSELVGSTGDDALDGQIRQSLAALQRFTQAPPASMPQPIRLRVVTGRG